MKMKDRNFTINSTSHQMEAVIGLLSPLLILGKPFCLECAGVGVDKSFSWRFGALLWCFMETSPFALRSSELYLLEVNRLR